MNDEIASKRDWYCIRPFILYIESGITVIILFCDANVEYLEFLRLRVINLCSFLRTHYYKVALFSACRHEPAFECVGFCVVEVHCDHCGYLDVGLEGAACGCDCQCQ